jgi:hypothetical protein
MIIDVISIAYKIGIKSAFYSPKVFLTKDLLKLKQLVVARIGQLLLSTLPINRGSLPDLKRLGFQGMQLCCNQGLLKSPGLEQTFNTLNVW